MALSTAVVRRLLVRRLPLVRPDPKLVVIAREIASIQGASPTDFARLEALRAALLSRLRGNFVTALGEMELPYDSVAGFALLQLALVCLRRHGWVRRRLLDAVDEELWRLEATHGHPMGHA